MKKIVSILLVLLLATSMIFAGGKKDATGNVSKIGVSMPTQSLQRWNQDGANMKSQLEAAGYKVDLQYAGDNDIPTQISQIENMVTGGCKVIVIAAIDGYALTDCLENAKAAGVTIIAYDRLIMNTDAVSYYATFDNWKVGTIQGEYIEQALNLKSAAGPFYMEFFTGDPGDNNINFFFDGAMSILTPYIESGKIVCLSGQTAKAQAATPGWATDKAQERMENIITSIGYAPDGKKLDAVLCSNDSTAQGVINALKEVGYTSANMPVVTGQDCDKPNVKLMIAGEQSMSIFKDTRTLASKVVEMVDAILKGAAAPVNDRKTYDNGTGIIPSYLCEPVFGTAENYKELLIDSGYYTMADIQ